MQIKNTKLTLSLLGIIGIISIMLFTLPTSLAGQMHRISFSDKNPYIITINLDDAISFEMLNETRIIKVDKMYEDLVELDIFTAKDQVSYMSIKKDSGKFIAMDFNLDQQKDMTIRLGRLNFKDKTVTLVLENLNTLGSDIKSMIKPFPLTGLAVKNPYTKNIKPIIGVIIALLIIAIGLLIYSFALKSSSAQ